MKPARIAVICIAAVSAIGLAFVVRAMGSSGQPVAVAAAAPVETRPMAKVLVAARDLEPGKRLQDADLEWKDWAVDEVNPAFITDGTVPVLAPPTPAEAKAAAGTLEGAIPAKTEVAKTGAAIAAVARAANNVATGGAKADYFGSVVREPILRGEPIVSRKIVRAGESGYLAAYLEPGMRAMAIRVTVETAAGGFILPGDRVDVLLTHSTSPSGVEGGQGSKFAASTVMRNIKVLAIDQTTRAGEDAQSVVGATATMEVGPADSEALALAKAQGELSLVLRSYADTGGPSGRVAQSQPQSTAVRIFRGGAPEVVVVQ